MENSVDPVHTEWLHGKLYEFVEREATASRSRSRKHHLKIASTSSTYGIIKRRLLEGQTEDADDWTIGHPLVFPNILAVGSAGANWRRVPLPDPRPDRRHAHACTTGTTPSSRRPASSVAARTCSSASTSTTSRSATSSGEYMLDSIHAQDIMAWDDAGPDRRPHARSARRRPTAGSRCTATCC